MSSSLSWKNTYTFLYLLKSNMKGSVFDNPESSQYYSKKVIRWIWEIEQCDAVGMGETSLNCRPPQCVRSPHCSPTTWQLLKTHGGLEYESDKPSSCAFCIAGEGRGNRNGSSRNKKGWRFLRSRPNLSPTQPPRSFLCWLARCDLECRTKSGNNPSECRHSGLFFS